MSLKDFKYKMKSVVGMCFSIDMNQIAIPMNKRIISFDMFDTLIYRKTSTARELFNIVQDKFCRKNQWRWSKGFAEIRLEAEYRARKKAIYNEVSLNDIYCEISGFSNEEKEILKGIEFATELEQTKLCNKMKRIYDECIKNGKEIIIISDMYLSGDSISEILHKEGVNYFSKVYVSSSGYGSKRNGLLYEYVLKDMGINRGELLHIGNDVMCDYLVPRRKGIDAVLIKSSTCFE